MNNQINKIYELATQTTFEETELENGKIISLINIRDTALDGGYENDEEAYKSMIQNELELLDQ